VKTVKDLLVEYFPEQTSAPAGSEDETKWLKSVLENLKTCIVSNNNKSNHNNNSTSTSSSPINANHKTNSNSNNNCHDNTNGDTNSTNLSSTSLSASMDNELILLQNAQLRTSVEEYKNIIAETVSLLKYFDKILTNFLI
jgi:hypothetical protein